MYRDQLKAEILKHFVEWNPELVRDMRSATHANEIDKPNPYHLEDTIWSHTMMVLKLIINKETDDKWLNLARNIVALTHDIGKVFTRKVKEDSFKVSFHGHEYASIRYTVDFIYHLKSIGVIDDDGRQFLIEVCLPVVSNHLEAYQRPLMGLDEFKNFVNYSVDVATVLVDLMEADNSGRFHLTANYQVDSEDRLLKYSSYIQSIVDYRRNRKTPIYIMGGGAGCGKDYIAKKYCENGEGVILSYDNIRLQLYRENNTVPRGTTPSEEYNFAFLWSIEKKIDFTPILRKQIDQALSDGKTVFISNTNCTRKARKGLLGGIANGLRKFYEFHMIYVVTDSETAYSRNRDRKIDKCLDDGVVTRFLNNQQIPLMLEGFETVRIIGN